MVAFPSANRRGGQMRLRLLAKDCSLLQTLGKRCQFEIALGHNGRIWGPTEKGRRMSAEQHQHQELPPPQQYPDVLAPDSGHSWLIAGRRFVERLLLLAAASLNARHVPCRGRSVPRKYQELSRLDERFHLQPGMHIVYGTNGLLGATYSTLPVAR
ncbi:hypothetical protein HPB50_007027 [Hyalomma asiaticum]|uniref:Uncharacterized protein n=1 Tax=Hyalomma asiaticum TaxID=266040 RepID=A0ACB7T1K5_HYAAI|nr:hypothetical protein HPB50_007027 [Hyalomma asiaticum]